MHQKECTYAFVRTLKSWHELRHLRLCLQHDALRKGWVLSKPTCSMRRLSGHSLETVLVEFSSFAFWNHQAGAAGKFLCVYVCMCVHAYLHCPHIMAWVATFEAVLQQQRSQNFPNPNVPTCRLPGYSLGTILLDCVSCIIWNSDSLLPLGPRLSKTQDRFSELVIMGGGEKMCMRIAASMRTYIMAWDCKLSLDHPARPIELLVIVWTQQQSLLFGAGTRTNCCWSELVMRAAMRTWKCVASSACLWLVHSGSSIGEDVATERSAVQCRLDMHIKSRRWHRYTKLDQWNICEVFMVFHIFNVDPLLFHSLFMVCSWLFMVCLWFSFELCVKPYIYIHIVFTQHSLLTWAAPPLFSLGPRRVFQTCFKKT
jgi:hypothetical protein